MNTDDINRIYDTECENCRKAKKKRPNADCQIRRGVFLLKSQTALSNVDKFFTKDGCKFYDPKDVR